MRGLNYKRHSDLQSLVSIMLRSDRRNISDIKDMPAEKDVVHMLDFYCEDVLIMIWERGGVVVARPTPNREVLDSIPTGVTGLCA